ncbi:MAG: inorganic phosphate transporter, partial [Bacteroidota bacterium]
RVVDKKGDIFKEPPKNKKPPMWIRATLIATCTGVSFFHGKNDGQKGVGLMMLVLLGIVPAYFALNSSKNPQNINKDLQPIEVILQHVDTLHINNADKRQLALVKQEAKDIHVMLNEEIKHDKGSDSAAFRITTANSIRRDILLMDKDIKTLINSEHLRLSNAETKGLKAGVANLRDYTDYAPLWVTVLISISLGIGTMVGWKRIVVTIGEKIGKSHLTYAQGASAELVAAGTIGLSSAFGLPVSTTHVLSSGIAGSMVAGGGIRNLQKSTIRNILLAWLLTFPASLAISGSLFLLFRWLL